MRDIAAVGPRPDDEGGRFGALHRDQGGVGTEVGDGCVVARGLPKQGNDRVVVDAVGEHHKLLGGKPPHDDVVDHSPGFGQEHRVLRPTGSDSVDVVAEQPGDAAVGAGSHEGEAPEV